ncbi:hypothetical protein AVEN_154477-1 [Araneus ventricosus]|uniref:Uncharacterized protein n=1 Tax=Araneus ventricosus TaxID=182803 RepID=A0A4Y2JGU0_ARAVE|nr:hypothetical protein AVEN_154477-1 [Araneus ventricosus]
MSFAAEHSATPLHQRIYCPSFENKDSATPLHPKGSIVFFRMKYSATSLHPQGSIVCLSQHEYSATRHCTFKIYCPLSAKDSGYATALKDLLSFFRVKYSAASSECSAAKDGQ